VADDEVAREDFLVRGGIGEASPTRFLPMGRNGEQIGILECKEGLKMEREGAIGLATTFNLNNGG